MNVITRPAWTVDSFLAWEREQEQRFEFDGVGPVAVNGGTVAHTNIAFQLAIALWSRIDRTRLHVLTSGPKLRIGNRIRYPDLMLVPQGVPIAADVIDDPILVVEVLSPSTERTDRLHKTAEYGETPSILHYVMLSQTKRAGTVYSRSPGGWANQDVENEMLPLPALGLDIPFDEIYSGLDFVT